VTFGFLSNNSLINEQRTEGTQVTMQSTPHNFFTGDFKTKREPEDEILILILPDRRPVLFHSENPFENMRRGQHLSTSLWD